MVSTSASAGDRIHVSPSNNLSSGVFFFLEEHELRIEKGIDILLE